MLIEEALEKLKIYAQELTKVGDAKQAIKVNKEEFLDKWAKVNQYYKYIVKNTKGMSDEWFMAVDIITDITSDNPSLEEWIDLIIDPKHQNNKTQSYNDTIIDTGAISRSIESIVTEVKNMQLFDEDQIGDIEWQLQEYQNKLISNQGLFEPNVYQSLMDDINEALNKIDKVNNMFNSNLMEDLKRM